MEVRESRRAHRRLGFFFLIAALVSIAAVDASVHDYFNEAFNSCSNAFFFHGGSKGLRTPCSAIPPSSSTTSSPNITTGPKGKSSIRFDDVTFIRTKESADAQNEMQENSGSVEAIILDIKDRKRIGGAYLKSDMICCTPQLAEEKACKLSQVIIQRNLDNPEWPRSITTSFAGRNQEAKMESVTVRIDKTGMYYLYFMFCDPHLKGTIIKGRTMWRNPSGYLPGKMAPLMVVFGLMSLAYLVLGLIWFLKFVQHWNDVIQLHYHITADLALGMCESALWYFEYSNLNSTGRRPMGITMWAVTFTAVKNTLSRLLLLVVSMGYGVVRPNPGGITSRVLLFGGAYLVASEWYELVEHLGNINDFSGKTALFLVLPVTLLDACFILWIFSSLSKTLEQLQVLVLCLLG